jgi:protease-4
MGRSLKKFLIVCLVLFVLAVGLRWLMKPYMSEEEKPHFSRNTIVHLDLDHPIWNGKKFLHRLKEFREETSVKAFLIEINSPGGAVGPSQEIFSEVQKTRTQFKKPVICMSRGIMASGAYYVAAACDKIVVAPGALIGSIGVIMEFANLEKLYDWAKVSRFSISSGRYKDSGAEYRSMREDERNLFQEMINEVYQQFRAAVMESRSLTTTVMDEYADGRVFTGSRAVKAGFADQVGTYEEALKVAADLAQLGEDYELYEIPKKKRTIFDLGTENEDDNVNALSSRSDFRALFVESLLDRLLGKSEGKVSPKSFWNQPLYMMPGS